MNWLEIVFFLCVIAVIVISYSKGFAKMLITTCTTIIAILVVAFVGNPVKELLAKSTQIDEKCETMLYDVLTDSMKVNETVDDKISSLGLPDFLTDIVKDSANTISGTIDSQMAALSKSIVSIAMTVLVDVLLFILVSVLLRCLARAMDVVTKLPLLHQLNGLAGALLGLVQMLLVLDVVFLIVTAIAHTDFGAMFTKLIEESSILSFLYQHNLVLLLISKFITIK